MKPIDFDLVRSALEAERSLGRHEGLAIGLIAWPAIFAIAISIERLW